MSRKKIWVVPTKGFPSYEPNLKIRFMVGVPTEVELTGWVKAQMAPDVRLLVEVASPGSETGNPQKVKPSAKVQHLTAAAATQAKHEAEKKSKDELTRKSNIDSKKKTKGEKELKELKSKAKDAESKALKAEQNSFAGGASSADKSAATKARNISTKAQEELKAAEAKLSVA